MTAATIERATHARYADWDRGEPDPTTATCTTHAVGAPKNKDTQATNSAKPLPTDYPETPCMVCGTEWADLIGQIVIDDDGGKGYLYGGPHPERGGRHQVEIGIGRGGPAVLRCDPHDVAPVGIEVPVKDARVTVVKVAKEQVPAHYRATKAGKWKLDLPGQQPGYFDTKKKATEVGLIRLAISDWHAARS